MRKYFNKKRKIFFTYITLLRFQLLKKMFTEDEKYLIFIALENRINNLEKIAITDKWLDKQNVENDCDEYRRLKRIFR